MIFVTLNPDQILGKFIFWSVTNRSETSLKCSKC